MTRGLATESKTCPVPPVIGHRGACGHAPENTLASIRRAAALGAGWVEFDARLTRDCEVVLLHDDGLERTTDGSGMVAEKDWAELRSLDAGAWYGAEFRGARIPSLGQAIAVLGELGLGANVEIKAPPGRDSATGRITAETLKAEWPAALPVPLISSFSPEALTAARDAAPDIPRALLVSAIPGDWQRQLSELGCNALHCDHEHLTRGRARPLLDAGFALRCYTVNRTERAAVLYGWGVAALISDYPERLLR
ncbi:MAG TPA: glycerophosphodiester phosphodiesterase [Alphaproteobacteria bacterium]|nr:glycerophosphodiester phosphodiesterase [Alphaproteobacteria bacterium]